MKKYKYSDKIYQVPGMKREHDSPRNLYFDPNQVSEDISSIYHDNIENVPHMLPARLDIANVLSACIGEQNEV